MKNLSTIASIIVALGVGFYTRLVFHVANGAVLSGFSFWEYVQIYFVGFYYDAATFLILGLPSLGLFLLGLLWRWRGVQVLFQWSVRLSLLIFALLNLTDAAYFRFSFHRMEYYDLLIAGDSWGTISKVMGQQFLLVVVAIVLVVVLWRLRFFRYKKPVNLRGALVVLMTYILLFVLIVLGRDFKPISPKQAPLYVPTEASELAINTPINLLYSYVSKSSSEQIPERHYYPDDYLLDHASLAREYESQSRPLKNVVIFLLESFSASFLEPGHEYQAPTPFLDSIRAKSLDMSFSFSGGFTSAQGLSCIATSVPNYIEYPFFYTRYRSIKYDSYIEILDSLGYHTSFFFGGNRDHFGFQKALSAFGVEHFYSGEDFPDQSLHDGYWGIYDGPFLQFFAEQLHSFSQPFFSIFFNLSSHYPFALPPDADSAFYTGNKITAHRSIRYVDRMLADFFDSVRHEDWFDETVFVFVGDHVSKEQDEEKYDRLTRYRVPMFFYTPGRELSLKIPTPAEHIDIGPTLMALLGYDKKFYAYGQDLGSAPADKGVMQYLSSNVYQYIDSKYLVEYDENKKAISAVYDHQQDKNLQNNLVQNFSEIPHYDSLIKLKLQNYSYRILNNRIAD